MLPVSWYLCSILLTQPWDTDSARLIAHGLTPCEAISTILSRMWFGRGRPLINTPPSWLRRPCPSHAVTSHHVTTHNKAIADLRPRPRFAIPLLLLRPIGRIACAQKFFRILFALAGHTEWSLLLHNVIGDWMILFAANAAETLQRLLQRRLPMLLNDPDNPRKFPLSLWVSALPSNTWFLEPTRVSIQNGISIGSAVLVWVANAILYNTIHCQWGKPPKLPLPNLGFRQPAEGGPSHDHRQHAQKLA